MRPRWPEEAIERLHQLYGVYSVEEVTNRLNREFSRAWTPLAVWKKADREGLKVVDAQGLLTLSETARQLGVPKKNVLRWVKRLGIKPTGRSVVQYIEDRDVERLRAAIGRPSADTVSTLEAARLLGVCQATVLKRIRLGNLRAFRIGKLWRVDASQLQRFDQWGRDRLAGGAA